MLTIRQFNFHFDFIRRIYIIRPRSCCRTASTANHRPIVLFGYHASIIPWTRWPVRFTRQRQRTTRIQIWRTTNWTSSDIDRGLCSCEDPGTSNCRYCSRRWKLRTASIVAGYCGWGACVTSWACGSIRDAYQWRSGWLVDVRCSADWATVTCGHKSACYIVVRFRKSITCHIHHNRSWSTTLE